ncbi:cathepsin L, partial [Thraustotheca clavata]
CQCSIGATVSIQGENALQSSLDKQAVQVIVEAGNNVWRNYKSGVVKSCPGAQSDHAVLAVGYGNLNGVDHFKIKNSWGSSWGSGGYIYLQRGVGGNGMCNVAEHPSYPTINVNPQPTSVSPTPTSKSPSPTTKSPSPTTKSPAPTTKKPDQCNGCTECYYPAGETCYDFDAYTCQDLSFDYGTIWCGN